jgi:KDO2-lipid IV(A) lauroyltransferase
VAEVIVFYLVVAPLLALLPDRLAYRAARWRGDWTFWIWTDKRREVLGNLHRVLGGDLSPAETERVARDAFRIRSCEIIDLMRLRGGAGSLARLVDIRGLEHLEAARAGGRGAILCGAHSGSYLPGFSLIHTQGFPVTTIGRWWWRFPPGQSALTGRIWEYVFARRVLRHRQRPNIEPWPGRMQVAVQAAAALRANEVITICSDAPPLDAERARVVAVPFLGQKATLLPGVVGLARLTGAPVLMATIRRSAGYTRQVLEISPPVPMQGDAADAFQRCVTAMDAAIRAYPAEWDFWFEAGDLARLGLLRDPAGVGQVAGHVEPGHADRAVQGDGGVIPAGRRSGPPRAGPH